MTLEDCVAKDRASEIIDADREQLEAWSEEHVLRSTVLPPAIIGYGNATLAAKIEALVHSIKLDAGAAPLGLQRYAFSVCSFCSDFGTEAAIPHTPPLNIVKLLQSVRDKSDVLACREPPRLRADHDEALDDGGGVGDVPGAGVEAEEFSAEEAQAQFCLSHAVFLPGIKHMLDNVSA